MERREESKEEPPSGVPTSPIKPIRKIFKTLEGQYRLVHECLHETKIAKQAKERNFKITSLSSSPAAYIHPCRISLVVSKPLEYGAHSSSDQTKEIKELKTKREESDKKKQDAELYYTIQCGDSIFLQPIHSVFPKPTKVLPILFDWFETHSRFTKDSRFTIKIQSIAHLS